MDPVATTFTGTVYVPRLTVSSLPAHPPRPNKQRKAARQHERRIMARRRAAISIKQKNGIPAIASAGPCEREGSVRAAISFVPIVRVEVCAVPVPVNVRVELERLQLRCKGSVPQDNVAAPLKPPVGVSVTVAVPVNPRGTVREAGFTADCSEGAVTVCVSPREVEFAKPFTPVKLAVMV